MTMDQLTKLLGSPDKTFKVDEGQSHWWAERTSEEADATKRIQANIHAVGVYAYPDRVEGGQKYNINFIEKR